MNKLISYLRSWGESLFNSKKEFIVNQGMPLWLQNHAQEIQLSYEDAHAGTPAPYDSYVQVRTSSSAGNTVVTAFSIGKRVFSLTGGATSGIFDCAFPVRKGDTIRVDSSSPESMGIVMLGFYKFVGGGVNSLLSQALQCVRGGGLCLNSLNTFALPLIRRLRELAQVIRLTPYLFLLKVHRNFQRFLQLMVGAAYIFQEISTAFIYQRITLSEVFLQPRGLMKVAPATLQDVSRFAKEKQLLALLEELQNLIITSCTSQNGKCLSNVFAKEVCYG